MSPLPQLATPLPQPLLRDYERLHARWREASDAADAVEDAWDAEGPSIDRALKLRLMADRLHREAMDLLRRSPL